MHTIIFYRELLSKNIYDWKQTSEQAGWLIVWQMNRWHLCDSAEECTTVKQANYDDSVKLYDIYKKKSDLVFHVSSEWKLRTFLNHHIISPQENQYIFLFLQGLSWPCLYHHFFLSFFFPSLLLVISANSADVSVSRFPQRLPRKSSDAVRQMCACVSLAARHYSAHLQKSST